MTLFWLGIAWLAGIGIGTAIRLPAWQWLVLSGLALGASLVFRRLRFFARAYLGLALLLLGAARAETSLAHAEGTTLSRYNDLGIRTTVSGVVVEPPSSGDWSTRLVVEADAIRDMSGQLSRPVEGRVLVKALPYDDCRYGDRVEVWGSLETPPASEEFSYRDYLARQGIHSWMPEASVTRLAAHEGHPVLQAIFDFRSRALRTVYSLFPDPEASLLAGILLGDESGISAEVQQAFNTTGTTHIIAISGFNLALIAGALIPLFSRWLGSRRGALAAGVALAVYTIFVGAAASVVRAAIMAGVSLMARQLGRQTDALASLSAAAVLMTAANPQALWDVGFQLSFAATLGLVLYGSGLRSWATRTLSRWGRPEQAKRAADPITEFGLYTLAAQLTTLPLIGFHFGRLSLVSWLANPAILPAQPAVLALGGLATLAGSVWIPLGRPFAWGAWPFVAYTIRAVEFFARLPGASWSFGEMGWAFLVVSYALIFGLTASSKLPIAGRLLSSVSQVASGAGLAVLGVTALLVWRVATDLPDGRLHVTVLDVGRGEAVLLESPSGRHVLISGGPSPTALAESLGRRLPLLLRGVDWIVIAGSDEEQVAGLAGAIDRFALGAVLMAAPPGGRAFQALADRLTERQYPIVPAQVGHALDLGGGSRLEVLGLGPRGAVLGLTYRRARIVFASGADPSLLQDLMHSPKVNEATALLLCEGGGPVLNPEAWLAGVHPRVALISVDAGNQGGLPSPEVLHALQGSTVLRTDLHGWIELTTDGEQLWVEVERTPKVEP